LKSASELFRKAQYKNLQQQNEKKNPMGKPKRSNDRQNKRRGRNKKRQWLLRDSYRQSAADLPPGRKNPVKKSDHANTQTDNESFQDTLAELGLADGQQ